MDLTGRAIGIGNKDTSADTESPFESCLHLPGYTVLTDLRMVRETS